MPKIIIALLTCAFGSLLCPNQARAEFRTAKDMQKECRVALAVVQGTAENTTANALLTGECIGFVQGVVDSAMALAENAKWYKVCVPDAVSTQDLIQKFIAFVDANPKYTLASTAIDIMLGQAFPCRK
jgi:Rap1a immunity proteins